MFFLCNHLSKNNSIKVNDFSGKGIKKYRNYLSKVCGLDFSSLKQEWEKLTRYRDLRNHLVHSEDTKSISKSKNDLIASLKKLDGLIMEEKDDIVTYYFSSTEIISCLIKITRKVLDDLYHCEYKPITNRRKKWKKTKKHVL